MTNESAGNRADAHFGEQGGRLTYGDYLQPAGLLDPQVPESSPPAHDELLFITSAASPSSGCW